MLIAAIMTVMSKLSVQSLPFPRQEREKQTFVTYQTRLQHNAQHGTPKSLTFQPQSTPNKHLLDQSVAVAAANGEVVTLGVVLADVGGGRGAVNLAVVRASEDGVDAVLVQEVLQDVNM